MNPNNHNLFRDYYLSARLPVDLAAYYPDDAFDLSHTFEQVQKLWHSHKGTLAESEDNVTSFVRGMCKVLNLYDSGQTSLTAADTSKMRVDLTLFADPAAAGRFTRAKGSGKSGNRYSEAAAVLEVERLGKSLDTDKNDNSNPSQQIINYLTYSKVQWGILTDGARWRLYRRFDPADRTRYLDFDLQAIIERDDLPAFRLFYAFFNVLAFNANDKESFLTRVWAGSQRYSVELQTTLRSQAFEVVEALARGIAAANPDTGSADLYEYSIVILYRLLFIKFAEDRQILPDKDASLSQKRHYRQQYGYLPLQDEILTKPDAGIPLLNTPAATGYWGRLQTIFKALYDGEPAFGIPPYDGTLFHADRLPDVAVTDGYLAQAIDKLARITTDEGSKARVDYKDLEVRHLGSIYEGLLEFHLVKQGDSVKLVQAGSGNERKTTGSYYTPDYVVEYIVQKTIAPLCEGKSSAEIEALKILDPAMGSGHFPVTALNYLAYYHARQQNREATPASPGQTMAEWEEQTRPTETQVAASERLLVDRCIYGVDLNPLAVELAKLALWLSTLSTDRPLYFLDHHLRTGNSLVGAWKNELRLPAKKRKSKQPQAQPALFEESQFSQSMHKAVGSLGNIAAEGQAAHVEKQQAIYRQLRTDLDKQFGRVSNLVTALALGATTIDNAPLKELAERVIKKQSVETLPQYKRWLDETDTATAENSFFHWQLQFPDIFFDENGNEKPQAGFDAVIGNPPYVRSETLSRDLKRYLKRYQTHAGTADLYAYFFEQGHRLLKPGGWLSFVVSNSWLKANYATSLRQFLRKNTTLKSLVDLGDNHVFADAPDVYPAIPVLQKQTAPKKHTAQVAIFERGETVDLSFENLNEKFISVSVHDQPDNGWRLVSQEIRDLFKKVSTGKQTLDDYCNGEIYRGVLTGLNKAFIIDQATRDRLIADDPNCETIIKPIVSGKDVRPWYVENDDQWLIGLTYGWTKETFGAGLSEPVAWEKLRAKYPTIATHLEPFNESGRKRTDKGEYWWELRPCSYYDKFEKPKILWPDICKYPRFVYDTDGLFLTNTGYIMPIDDLYALGFLSSRVAWFIVTQISIPLGERAGMNRYRLIDQYMRPFPIPDAVPSARKSIASLAEQLSQTAKKRHKLYRTTRHRILTDLGGTKLNQKLTFWWELSDFTAFRTEIKKAFKTDIPVGERDDWETYLQTQQETHHQLTNRIIADEQALNTAVYKLFNLNDAEIKLIEDTTKYDYGAI